MQKDQLKFPITGNEGAPIDRKTGIQWTSNYRQIRPGERISHFFGRTHLQDLLNQQDCMGIRIYYANSMQPNAWQRFILAISNFLRKGLADAEGEEHLILVGTTREGTDQARKGVVKGQSVSVSVDLGGSRYIKKNKNQEQ